MDKSTFLTIACVLMSSVICVGSEAEAQMPTYQMKDLGTLGGTMSWGYRVNDTGQVIGLSYNSNNYRRGFLYENGQMVDLGTPCGQTYGHSTTSAINESGQIAGGHFDCTGSRRAYLYSDGVMTDLGTLNDAYYYSDTGVFAINSSGDVVGYSTTTTYYEHAMLYRAGQMIDLGLLPGAGSTFQSSRALAINDVGQVVGYSEMSDAYGYRSHGFIYDDNDGMVDIPPFVPGMYSNANDINEAGQVTGQAQCSGFRPHAYVRQPGGGRVDLEGSCASPRYSLGVAINDAGQVAGYGGPALGQPWHAFLYSAGQMIDLGTLGGAYSSPTAINNVGQVIGTANNAAGAYRPFLYSNGSMKDVNSLVRPVVGLDIVEVNGINTRGQIAGTAQTGPSTPFGTPSHAILLTPIAALLEDLRTHVTGVGPGGGLSTKVATIQSEFSSQDLAGTCSAISDFNNLLRAQRGKKLDVATADRLLLESMDIATAIGCS